MADAVDRFVPRPAALDAGELEAGLCCPGRVLVFGELVDGAERAAGDLVLQRAGAAAQFRADPETIERRVGSELGRQS